MARLAGLSPAEFHESTETAQRFLATAYDSIEAVLDLFDLMRDLRKMETGDVRGRLAANEEDLLRAAVVFAGAGLDAALKQLIRDALPRLLLRNEQAHTKFEEFAKARLTGSDGADPARLAHYLTAANPRERLIEDYILDLTGSSLQSAEEVQRAAGALGIDNPSLRKRISGLRPVFVARNEIAHELDLQRPEKRGDRKRRTRRMQATIDLCHEAVEVGQLMINAVAQSLV